MEQELPREMLWAERTSMQEYLCHPLNQKIYEVYLNIKRQTNEPHRDSLKLFNEVYYICSRVIYENANEPNLSIYIAEIKKTMGWDYTTSLVMQMVYAVLALRQGNTIEVSRFVQSIKAHYRMDERVTPFGAFVAEEEKEGCLYDIDFDHESMIKAKNNAMSEALLKYINKVQPVIHVEHADIRVESPGNYIANQITTK